MDTDLRDKVYCTCEMVNRSSVDVRTLGHRKLRPLLHLSLSHHIEDVFDFDHNHKSQQHLTQCKEDMDLDGKGLYKDEDKV